MRMNGRSSITDKDPYKHILSHRLFVSPAKPPTPSQKRVTPSQWLERGGVATVDDPVFSLDEVRKDLSFQISNAESLSPSGKVRRTPGGIQLSVCLSKTL